VGARRPGDREDRRQGNRPILPRRPEKLDDPFPDLAYFRTNRPIFYHEALDQWFAFGHEDVSTLFSDPRMSADRMKGFVDAAPEEVRDDLRRIASYLELFVLMNDDPEHARAHLKDGIAGPVSASL
jgi:cytochrome P450